MIQAHCMYCALCFCYYISSISDHWYQIPEAEEPCLRSCLRFLLERLKGLLRPRRLYSGYEGSRQGEKPRPSHSHPHCPRITWKIFKNTDHAQRGSDIISLEMEFGHWYFLISPQVMLTLQSGVGTTSLLQNIIDVKLLLGRFQARIRHFHHGDSSPCL